MATEHSFAFGARSDLIGTLTFPSQRTSGATPGLILFNAGVLPRIGPHRLNVNLARRLAGLGVATLRFDLHGHGDSARADGRLGFFEQVDADLRDAMDQLVQRAGVQRIAILGYCSGAYPELRIALSDSRVDSVLLFDGFAWPTLRATLRRYRLRVRQRGTWGAVSGWATRVVPGLATRLADRLRTVWQPVNAAVAPTPDVIIDRAQLVRDLNTLAQRGVRVIVLASGDSFERVNYAGQFRDATRKHGLSERVITEFLPEIDHVVTSLRSQRIFCDFVAARWLQLSMEPSGSSLPAARPLAAASPAGAG